MATNRNIIKNAKPGTYRGCIGLRSSIARERYNEHFKYKRNSN
jgi:hypothetical protein